jgi:hypothetical protein
VKHDNNSPPSQVIVSVRIELDRETVAFLKIPIGTMRKPLVGEEVVEPQDHIAQARTDCQSVGDESIGLE